MRILWSINTGPSQLVIGVMDKDGNIMLEEEEWVTQGTGLHLLCVTLSERAVQSSTAASSGCISSVAKFSLVIFEETNLHHPWY